MADCHRHSAGKQRPDRLCRSSNVVRAARQPLRDNPGFAGAAGATYEPMSASSSFDPSLRPAPDRVSVAPMMDWTDRHCRYFHRLLTKRTRLYTEMVTTGALLHGNVPRHLDSHPQ